ncbi:MAG: hypothetical protein IJ869_00135 [Clostridiales bacterium]|nr:hypothetical protein [Clostridiales bacterium]
MADNMEPGEEYLDDIKATSTVDVTDKKCPNCGATVVYNPETLTMACDFCGYTRALPQPEEGKEIEELDFESAKIRQSQDWGTKKKSIECKNCGGNTIYDEAETAAVCPFCGSTNVMPVDDDENVMAPGGVVPFEISQEKAAELFEKWLKGKLFAPTAAKKSCKAKNFNGIYLPYWTYDTQTTSPYRAKLGFEYRVKKGDSYETKVRWATYSGVYEEFIDDQIVYASKKTTNSNIEAVSDFDFSKLKPYDPQYIAGFVAERYTVGLDEGWTKAKQLISQKLRSNLSSKLRRQYNADRVGELNMSTSYDKVTFKYLLAPIWMANYKFNGTVYNFVVNGQTGRVAGKSPVSVIKVIIAIIIAIAIIAILMALLNN